MQDVMSCLLSLFASLDDAMEVHGAVQWLMKAYEDYRNRVVNNQISYKVFIEEFHVRLSMPIFLSEGATYNDLLIEATDRDKVKHILENRRFTEQGFNSLVFEEGDAIKMIARYNAIGTKEAPCLAEDNLPLSDYPQEVKEGFANVINKHQMLSPAISSQDLELLLSTGKPSCNYMIPPNSRNVDFGLFINILITAGALTRKWCNTIVKGGMLLTSTGEKMKRTNLSAAVHRFNNCQPAYLDYKQTEIKRDIMEILSGVPGIAKKTEKSKDRLHFSMK